MMASAEKIATLFSGVHVDNQRSLIFKLMICINIVSIIVILALSASIMFNTMKSTDQMITQEMSTLGNSVTLTSADYAWNFNTEVLTTIAKQLLNDPSIESVKYIDVKNVVITEAKKEIKDKSSSNRSIKLPVIYEDKTIAFLEMTYNLNKVEKVKNDFLKLTFMGIIIAQIIMFLVLYFVLKKTTTKLGLITEKLRTVSQKNQVSSEAVQKISENVSSSTQEQASSIQETVSTLDEITSMVNTSVESAQNSSIKADESLSIASEGQEVVKKMIFSMEEINKSNSDIMEEIHRSNARIGEIVKVINEISQKTTVINDIVFQTKLLSFNASVEAARAGENGKGFSVVAEEVGNLAKMSGTASNEISSMLEESIVKVNNIIKETSTNIQRLVDIGNQKVKDGATVADRCGEVLNEVVVNATIVKKMMNEVSLASKEQAEGVKNIALAMNQLDQTTLSNAESASHSSQSSKELSLQADELHSNVQELEREIFGSIGFIKTHGHSETKPATENKKSSNVIEIKKPVAKKPAEPKPIAHKKVSGEVPSANDNRFEDV